MKKPLVKALRPLIWIIILSFIYAQGFAQVAGETKNDEPDHSSREKAVSNQADADDTDREKNIVKHKKQNKTMLYKFYKETTKPEASQANSHNLVDEFKKIYDKNDVEFLGLWINADDPHEQFYMTGFKNNAHYLEFLDEVKNNQEYREMSDEINRHRESIESVTLEPASDLDIESSEEDYKLYKFYREKTRASASQSGSNNLIDEFKKIYDRNDVDVVGVWINADDPHEQYFMTGYRDEAHYRAFIEKANTNPEYQEMTDKVNKDREFIEVLTLIPADN